ncbi:MAG: hypothetical protein R3Y63_09125 [Eubacteriales bacterium]
MDKQKYRSYSQLFTQAVNHFFAEKEEADLLPEIRKMIKEEVGKIQVVSVEKFQEGNEETLAECNSEEDIQKAFDFIDSF